MENSEDTTEKMFLFQCGTRVNSNNFPANTNKKKNAQSNNVVGCELEIHNVMRACELSMSILKKKKLIDNSFSIL
jgi:hypothetical protein